MEGWGDGRMGRMRVSGEERGARQQQEGEGEGEVEEEEGQEEGRGEGGKEGK